jgi:hypothetical protein
MFKKIALTAALITTVLTGNSYADDKANLIYTSALMSFSGRYCPNTSHLQPMKEIAEKAYAEEMESDPEIMTRANRQIANELAKKGLKKYCADLQKSSPIF